MGYAIPPAPFAAFALIAVSACAPTDGTYFREPEAKPDTVVEVPEGTTIADLQKKLRGMGFGTGKLTARSISAAGRGGAFVDCGSITQVRDGNVSVYSGSTPLSILYTDLESRDFLTRQIAVLTRANVTLSGTQATVSERHEITMLWTSSDGSGTKRQSKAIDGGETVTFEDGTICATGTGIAENLR